MYEFHINKSPKQHRGHQPEHAGVTVHAHAIPMQRPGHDKAKRQSWPAAAKATASFLALVVGMLLFLLWQQHHAAAQFELSSPQNVVAYLRHMALQNAHNAAHAQEVFAVAQHIEKVLAQSPDVAAKLQKAAADLSAAQQVVAKQDEALRMQSQASAQQLEELRNQVQQLQAQQQQAGIQAAAANTITDAAAGETARLQALATAGDACGVLHNAGVLCYSSAHPVAF
jgi:preprotein translocase subunit SecF